MDAYIPITEARNNFPKLVEEVNGTMSHVTITKNGKPYAVILSSEEYEDFIETLEILADHNKMARLREAEREAKQGKGKTLEQVAEALSVNL